MLLSQFVVICSEIMDPTQSRLDFESKDVDSLRLPLCAKQRSSRLLKMNPNEEFVSSNEADVTGSSKSSFIIGVTLA